MTISEATPASGVEHYAINDGELSLFRRIFSEEQAAHLFSALQNELNWQQDYLNFGSKTVAIPRLQAWYGDAGADYQYSGLKMQTQAWTPHLLQIKHHIECLCNTRFNSVLANWYRNGQDSVSWHQDNEPELGQNPSIASVSLGAERPFQLKHKRHKQDRITLRLPHNSLLLMGGSLQHYWQHQLPKVTGLTEPRINLTFRQIITV